MTHDPTNHLARQAVVRSFLARHAAARIWRHLADDPETDQDICEMLLTQLPTIEADPLGADWRAAYRAAEDSPYWPDPEELEEFGYELDTSGGTFWAIATYESIMWASDVARRAASDDTDAFNAQDAVELGCAGSDRIGTALTLLAENDDFTAADAWDLSGLVTT